MATTLNTNNPVPMDVIDPMAMDVIIPQHPHILQTPTDALKLIFERLNVQGLGAIQTTCKHLHSILSDDTTWAHLFEAHFPLYADLISSGFNTLLRNSNYQKTYQHIAATAKVQNERLPDQTNRFTPLLTAMRKFY